MALPLTTADFPLYAVGPSVYSRNRSSPLFVAPDDQLADDLVVRLNRDEMRAWGMGNGLQGPTVLVYGRG